MTYDAIDIAPEQYVRMMMRAKANTHDIVESTTRLVMHDDDGAIRMLLHDTSVDEIVSILERDDALSRVTYWGVTRDDVRHALTYTRDVINALDVDALSLLRYEHSLCPMHACDYAMCFDDDDDECAAIRVVLPSHDT